MIRSNAPELDQLILEHLAHKYNLTRKRDGIHLSTLIGCLTRSFLDLKSDTVQLTENEVMLFATGWALQAELMPPQATAPVILTSDGITYSPDMVFALEGLTVELKTTRSGIKRYVEGDYPDSWIKYIMGGCHILGISEYLLSVFYISERPFPKLHSERLTFDQFELDANWERLSVRRDEYKRAMREGTPPSPFKWNEDYECKGCRHYTTCTAVNIMTGGA
jgi:hypothetical protein